MLFRYICQVRINSHSPDGTDVQLYAGTVSFKTKFEGKQTLFLLVLTNPRLRVKAWFQGFLICPRPAPHACLLLAVLLVFVQVKNMNHPGLQAVLLGRLSVRGGRMDEERQELRLTAPASLHPSLHLSTPSKPSVCSLLSLHP